MKIPDRIVLVVKDVEVWPGGLSQCFLSGRDCEHVNTVMSSGQWCRSSKKFVCDKVLDTEYGWLSWVNWRSRFKDVTGIGIDNLELSENFTFDEVMINLQLHGARFVFEAPKKLLRALESKCCTNSEMKPWQFEMTFNELKTKCRRLV